MSAMNLKNKKWHFKQLANFTYLVNFSQIDDLSNVRGTYHKHIFIRCKSNEVSTKMSKRLFIDYSEANCCSPMFHLYLSWKTIGDTSIDYLTYINYR